MNEAQIREQAARARREFIRWVLLMAAEINSPTKSTLRMLVGVVQGAYSDATDMEVRRELDYLESRKLMEVHVDPLNQVTCELTRDGFDVAQYTVDVEPGIARPPKA